MLQSLSPFLSIRPQGGLHVTKAVSVDTGRFHASLIAWSDDVSINEGVELQVCHEPLPPLSGKKVILLRLKGTPRYKMFMHTVHSFQPFTHTPETLVWLEVLFRFKDTSFS